MSLVICRAAFAVWPPSTSLEKETVSEKDAKAGHKRLDIVVQRLEEDERRLAALLDALEKDQKSLNNRSTTNERDEHQGDRKKK